MESETCQFCDGTGLVCENHPDKPWDGESDHPNACGCGAGAPCGACGLIERRIRETGKPWT